MKKISFLFCLSLAMNFLIAQTTNKIIFNEDFGKSTSRIGSQYVPQSGKDNTLGVFDSHGSSFYQLADKYYQEAPYPIKTDRKTVNQDVWNIDNGFYAVIAPKSIYNFSKEAPDGTNFWQGSWWRKITNHTDNSDDGAVLVVNGGTILNQYYRRVAILEPGKSYRISTWIFGSGTTNVGVNFEAQNIETEVVIGSSKRDFPNGSDQVNLKEQNTWEQKYWVFKTPDNKACSTVSISLRNNKSANSGNDFYVDDIVLEEVEEGGNVLDCTSSPEIDALINAYDDRFTLTDKTDVFNIISNDSYNNEIGKVVLSGTDKNATIAIINEWPTGITLNSDTGEIIIRKGTTPPTEPLRYQICNTLGVCSMAEIILDKSLICTKDSVTGTPNGFTMVGISTYNQNDNFPNNIPNGFLALQSSNKGMVITRTTSDKILQPLEGMIIYDTNDQCTKLYNGSIWNCIKKTCNN